MQKGAFPENMTPPPDIRMSDCKITPMCWKKWNTSKKRFSSGSGKNNRLAFSTHISKTSAHFINIKWRRIHNVRSMLKSSFVDEHPPVTASELYESSCYCISIFDCFWLIIEVEKKGAMKNRYILYNKSVAYFSELHNIWIRYQLRTVPVALESEIEVHYLCAD